MNRSIAALSRRRLFQSIPLGALGSYSLAKGSRTSGPPSIKLAWNANAVCLSPVPLAQQKGIFARHNLNVEFVNYAGSTDELLEAISTGKADAGVGMILRWLNSTRNAKASRGTCAANAIISEISSVDTPTILAAKPTDLRRNYPKR